MPKEYLSTTVNASEEPKKEANLEDKLNKKTYHEREIVQKKEDGSYEVIQQVFSKTVTVDKFIQTYVEGIRGLLNLDSKTDIRVLIALWERAEFSTNKLILIKSEKELIAESLGYRSYKIVDNAILRLKKKGILIKGGRSLYYLNPNFFFKGYQKDRNIVIDFVYRIQQSTE